MGDDGSFLARWSRRKRSAATGRGEPRPETAENEHATRASVSAPPRDNRPLFDPASLPPIEAIGTGSDLRPFLALGVPPVLMRAALRRAWSADPAIRDFIGLSENSWDFNAPDGVPGFGAVTAEDVRRLLAQMTEGQDAASTAPVTAASAEERPVAASGDDPAERPAPTQSSEEHALSTRHQDLTRRGEVYAAVQHDRAAREYCSSLPRRRHGGALPK